MPSKQQTLSGEILDYEPSSPGSSSNPDPPVCGFLVIFRPASGGVTSENVYIQDCPRDGMSPQKRAYLAASHQTPFDIGQVMDIDRQEKTKWSIDASDEWRVDDY